MQIGEIDMMIKAMKADRESLLVLKANLMAVANENDRKELD